MRYIPSFEQVRRSISIATVKGELRVSMAYEDFVALVKSLLEGVDVDEAWYLRQYEDIAAAVKTGEVASARRHFVDDGFFEGRRPFPIQVDETWYCAQNPDVADGVKRGELANGQQHFDVDGYREGRRPFPAPGV